MSTAAHWDDTYGARPTSELGWYEPVPATLDLVLSHLGPDESVIDVGAGASHLVDELLERGFRDITVLDVSTVALDRTRSRLGARAADVDWVHHDVTTFRPHRTWDLWHDRAVFHFLVSPDDRAAYTAVAGEAVRPGGHLVIAAFALDGPDHCAGLPVCRYDAKSLVAEFSPAFEPTSSCSLTPERDVAGDQRPYVGCVLRRAAD